MERNPLISVNEKGRKCYLFQTVCVVSPFVQNIVQQTKEAVTLAAMQFGSLEHGQN